MTVFTYICICIGISNRELCVYPAGSLIASFKYFFHEQEYLRKKKNIEFVVRIINHFLLSSPCLSIPTDLTTHFSNLQLAFLELWFRFFMWISKLWFCTAYLYFKY